MAEYQAPELVRLNKYIADCGIASRRKADSLIQTGQVRVNGKTIRELGQRIDPRKDKVFVKGKPVRPENELVYVLFNKPLNVLTSMSDPDGRPTVADFFQKLKVRIFPVGRLDWDSEGMLILTNDGEFAQAVAHPREEIPKTYMVKLNGQPSDPQLDRLKKGVTIPGGRVKALSAERIRRGSDKYDWIKIVISEGKNRQIRFMFQKIGFDVKKLKRVAIGQLRMGPLKPGEFRPLKPSELRKVFAKRRVEKPRMKSAKRPKSVKS